MNIDFLFSSVFTISEMCVKQQLNVEMLCNYSIASVIVIPSVPSLIHGASQPVKPEWYILCPLYVLYIHWTISEQIDKSVTF